MAEETLLTDEFLRQLINVGEVDIVVGLSTHNHAKTIPPIIAAIQAGLLKCFPRERAAIINADGGSHDGTPELVTGAAIDDIARESKVYALRTLHAISTRYGVTPDPGIALRTILAATDLLRAKACVLISPDATAIEPDWLQRLVRPVYDNFDLVCPLYHREKLEGALTRNLLYPMTRSIYGCRIQEPYGSDFAISGRLATDFVANGIYNEDWGRMGPEISITIMAIAGKYRVCQSFLGTKVQADRGSSDLVAVMRRTVGALFSSLDSNFPQWSTIKGSQPVTTFGGAPPASTAEVARINRKRLRELFSTGVAQLEPVFDSILSPSTLSQLQKMTRLDNGDFKYPADIWTRTVLEFAAAYHRSVINRDHIIQALIPLYRGRALTFLQENRNGSMEEIDSGVESLCNEFEQLKPYLLEIWADKK